METVAGIFTSRAAAESAVQGLQGAGIANERIVFLTPGTTDENVESAVATTETEQPGMGQAMGGAVGGAMGAAGGATLGAAAVSLLVPGVGPILAGGLVGAALFGAGGAATGMAAGAAMEKNLATGLPHDELYLYEDALRQGRSVVIAFAEDSEAESVRDLLTEAGAESIDAARESWWLGLRDAEEESYRAQGKDFQSDEISYRRGFESALNPKMRGKSYEEASSELSAASREAASEEAFRQGYERGQSYQRTLAEKFKR